MTHVLMTADEPSEGACEGANLLCKAVSDLAQSGLREFVQSLTNGAVDVISWINQIWFAYSPWREVDLRPDRNGELDAGYLGTSALTDIQGSLSWYTAVFAMIGFLIAVGRMIITRELRSGAGALGMIVRLIVVTSVMSAMFAALMYAGDSFAEWILTDADDKRMNLTGVLNANALASIGLGPGLLLGLFALLGALANIAFLILRDALVLVMFAFLPTLAASTVSESGTQAFKKALAWLLSFLLYKPIAATIWALGLLLVKEPTVKIGGGADAQWDAMYQSLIGVVILLCTAAALPAIIKLISPAASVGTSSAFSGGAVAGAAIAAGAAVVSLGATAAAGAPAAAAPAATSAGAGAAGGGSAAGGLAAGNTNPPPPSGGATPAGTGGASTGSNPPSTSSSPSSDQATAGTGAAPSGSSGAGADGGASGAAAGPASSGSATATSTPDGAAAAPASDSAVAAEPDSAVSAAAVPAPQPAGGSAWVRDAARAAGDVAQLSQTADGAMSDTTQGERQ